MPRVLRTVVPRIRKSLNERGVLVSISRAALLPIHLVREYRAGRKLQRTPRSDFDIEYMVDTDGDFDDWTYLSDLNIESTNWIYGHDYTPIEPARLRAVLSALPMPLEELAFVDFGSGKGRSLIIASEFPFKKIVGIEFSPELHTQTEVNIRNGRNPRQLCRAVTSVCMDFCDFKIPEEPVILFFFDPCALNVFSRVLDNVRDCIPGRGHALYIVYVAAGKKEAIMDAAPFLVKVFRNDEYSYCVYKAELPSQVK